MSQSKSTATEDLGNNQSTQGMDVMGFPIIGTTWRHYKGAEYLVVGKGILEENLQVLVLYRLASLTGDEQEYVWARPLDAWQQFVPYNGKIMTRFVLSENEYGFSVK